MILECTQAVEVKQVNIWGALTGDMIQIQKGTRWQLCTSLRVRMVRMQRGFILRNCATKEKVAVTDDVVFSHFQQVNIEDEAAKQDNTV